TTTTPTQSIFSNLSKFGMTDTTAKSSSLFPTTTTTTAPTNVTNDKPSNS
ncbi:unnamed protein product, partial [Rotaria sp. Silwood1]